MMMSMIYSNSQDLFLNHVMNDIFRADVGYLHKEKIKIMVSYIYIYMILKR